ncbi:MAG: ATP-binding protein [Acidobacteria bacterium]|nr:ATP-binding protein [Acidobacteriota bacterium]
MPDEALQVSIMPRVTELQALSRRVEEYGDARGLPEPTVFVINLALDELITNSVMHGFTGVGDPHIDIGLLVEGNSLKLTVKDNGAPFDPTADTDPDLDSSLEDRRIGGLGLHLVKSFANRIHYEYVDGQNCLTLEHDLQRASE